jgi:hypothetical protein
MRNRSRMTATAVAATAALVVGQRCRGGVGDGWQAWRPARSVSASEKKGGPSEKAGHDAIVVAMAAQLHVSTGRVNAAMEPVRGPRSRDRAQHRRHARRHRRDSSAAARG